VSHSFCHNPQLSRPPGQLRVKIVSAKRQVTPLPHIWVYVSALVSVCGPNAGTEKGVVAKYCVADFSWPSIALPFYIYLHIETNCTKKNNTFILVYFRTNTWSSTRMVSTFHELLLFYIYNLFLKSCDVVLIYTWTKKCHQDLSKSLKHYILAYSLKCGAKTFLQVHVYLYAWGYFFLGRTLLAHVKAFWTCWHFVTLFVHFSMTSQ